MINWVSHLPLLSHQVSFIHSCNYGDYNNQNKSYHNNSNDYLHFQITAVHFSLNSRRTRLKHLRIFSITSWVPLRSSAFLCKPSRLTWLSNSFLVLSEISSFILITSHLHHLKAYWLSRFYLNLLICCIFHLSQLVCLLHVTSMCPSYDISYIWFTRIIA